MLEIGMAGVGMGFCESPTPWCVEGDMVAGGKEREGA